MDFSSVQAKVELLFIYATARRRLRLALRKATIRTAAGVCLAGVASSMDLGQVRDPMLLVAAMLVAYSWISDVSAAKLNARLMMNARVLLPQDLLQRIRRLDDFDALGLIIKIAAQGAAAASERTDREG